jgi:hypothetical protein
MIQNLLTTPRQAPTGTTGTLGGGAGGIAGVASNAPGEGIHLIGDKKSKYKEWEFIYDLKNDKSALGLGMIPQQQLPTTPVNPGFGASPSAPGTSGGATSPASPAGPAGPVPPTQPPPG